MFIKLDPEFQKTFDSQENLFDQIMTIDGERYRALENRHTIKFSRNHKTYFIKQHFGVGWREIFKNLLYLKLPVIGAQNEWRAILAFEQIGVDTMKLVGYGYRGTNPAKIQSFVVTEALQNVESMEDFCANWQPSFYLKKALIEKLAEISRKLHTHGINHRDFYLCHFMLDHTTLKQNEIKLYLIDLHRVQIRKRTPSRWAAKDIAGLYFSSMDAGLTKRDIFRFLKYYFDIPLREILKTKKDFLRRVEKRAVKLYIKTFQKKPPSSLYFYTIEKLCL